MRPAEVPGIANVKLVLEPPLATQRIVAGRDRNDLLILAPVRNNVDTISRNAPRGDGLCHIVAQDNISCCGFQTAIAQIGNGSQDRPVEKGYSQLNRDLGIDILQPIDQLCACAIGNLHRDERNQRRDSHGDNNVVGLCHSAERAPGRRIKGEIIDRATYQPRSPEMSGGYAVNSHVLDGILRQKMNVWVVVELLAGDDMHLVSTRGQVDGDVADQLACGGMIGRKKAIEEDNALHERASVLRTYL